MKSELSVHRGFVDSPEGQLHYRECGNGPIVVLIHQALRSSLEFRKVLQNLGKSHRAIAFEVPGFGDSARPEDAMEIEDYARVLMAGFDGLRLDPFAIGGHHTGASIALEIALSQPDRVTGLILSGPALVTSEKEREQLLNTLNDDEQTTVRVDGSHLLKLWSEGKQSAFGNARIPETELGLLTEFLLEQIQGGDRRGDAHLAAFRYEMERRLPLVEVPVLILSGADDMWACRRDGEVAALLPKELTVLRHQFESAGEYPRLQPVQLADSIGEFLRHIKE